MLTKHKKLFLENISLSNKVEELRLGSSLDDRKGSSAELVQTLQKLTKIQEEYRDIEKSLKEAKLKIEDLEKKSIEDSAIILAKDEEIKKLQSTLETYKSELNDLQVSNVKFDEEIKALEREKNDLLKEVLSKSHQNAELANKLVELQGMLQTSNYEVYQSKSNESSGEKHVIEVPLPKKVKKVVTSHKGELNCVAYNSFGSVVATAGTDKVIRVWDALQFSNTYSLHGPIQTLMVTAFSPDDQFVLGSSNDNSTRIWLTKTQRVRHTLNGHTSKVFSSVFSPDSQKVITGSHDRSIKLWDMTKGHNTKTIFCYSSCNAICLSANGNIICSGHFDSSLRLWDIRTGENIGELSGIHSGQITSVSPGPESLGNSVLTNSRDNTLKLIDIGTQKTIQTYKHDNYINSANWTKACISPDGQYIASGSADGGIYIWETASGKINNILQGHKDAVTCVAWNPMDISRMVSCDKSGSVLFWEP